jgi:hypothetical protein
MLAPFRSLLVVSISFVAFLYHAVALSVVTMSWERLERMSGVRSCHGGSELVFPV